MSATSDLFIVIEVPSDAERDAEAMGTKPKFWFTHPWLGHCLYKQGHQGTGEDWVEKIAAELCRLLDLPHARYELAVWEDTRGVVSPSFVPDGGMLVPGNEILLERDESYPRQQRFRVKHHTIEAVFSALDSIGDRTPLDWHPPQSITTASQTFVGYLMLDAWIGNTDRHHENWAFVHHFKGGGKTEPRLAPTHDHAAGLGAILRDEERLERLMTRDQNRTIAAYANRGRSALFAQEKDSKSLLLVDALRLAAQHYNDAAK